MNTIIAVDTAKWIFYILLSVYKQCKCKYTFYFQQVNKKIIPSQKANTYELVYKSYISPMAKAKNFTPSRYIIIIIEKNRKVKDHTNCITEPTTNFNGRP